MSNTDLILSFTLVISGLAGAIGGLLAVLLLKLRDRNMHTLTLTQTTPLNVQVQLCAEPVNLQINVRQPEAVVVEVVTTGGPTQRELAARVIATMPSIGPTDLAQIVQCSKSTAHAIIRDAREGRLNLPDVEIEEAP